MSSQIRKDIAIKLLTIKRQRRLIQGLIIPMSLDSPCPGDSPQTSGRRTFGPLSQSANSQARPFKYPHGEVTPLCTKETDFEKNYFLISHWLQVRRTLRARGAKSRPNPAALIKKWAKARFFL